LRSWSRAPAVAAGTRFEKVAIVLPGHPLNATTCENTLMSRLVNQLHDDTSHPIGFTPQGVRPIGPADRRKAILALLATGAILLIANVTWGVTVVAAGDAALLFTVAVPHISSRVLHRFDAALSGTAP
jgi:hypothetical protein